jgi:hypothetical protein
MKDLIKNILRENIQQADKYYFNNGKLSPKVREIILKITNGDPYTKLVTDMYYYTLMDNHKTGNWALSQLDSTHKTPENPKNDVMDIKDIRDVKNFYNEVKNYNKNVFPISGFNLNGVDNMPYFISALKQRRLIMDLMSKLPSVAARNIKSDIRQERDYPSLQDFRSKLEYFMGLYSMLSNRDPEMRKNIENKIFKGESTLKQWIDFADERENLLGGGDLNKKNIKDIVGNSYDLDIIYSKGNIMVVEVSGAEGIKEIGCNSLWCFTYAGKFGNYGDWVTYSTNGLAYVIIDFSEKPDSLDFMHVLIKPLPAEANEDNEYNSTLFNMANNEVSVYVISNYIEYDKARRLMNFDEEIPKEKKPKQRKVDTNQLSFAFENKSNLKKILREYYNDEDEENYNDEDEENYSDEESYFNAKISKEIKRRSSKYEGRGVVWYGDPDQMIVIAADNVDGMWGNVYDERKLASVQELIKNTTYYGEKVEFECSYGIGDLVSFIQIKEEQTAEKNGEFESEYDGRKSPSSTGDADLDEYVGTEDILNLPFISYKSEDEIHEFFDRNRFSLVENRNTVQNLINEFKTLNPTPLDIESFDEFLNYENMLKEAQENGNGDFGSFRVQLRDGHHRVMGAIAAGERYICVNLDKDGIKEFQGHYTKI